MTFSVHRFQNRNIQKVSITLHIQPKSGTTTELKGWSMGKSMDWFLYDNGLRHKRVKFTLSCSPIFKNAL